MERKMELPTEVRARYVQIIDEILAKADLTQVTEKKIRNGIQEVVQYDITPQKATIKELIMQRFDIFNARQNGETEPVPSVEKPDPPTTNGHAKPVASTGTSVKREADDSDMSDVIDKAPPKKKKRKESAEDDDATFAAKLQAEEDRNSRPTRGGAPRKSATKKQKKPVKKKKTTTKVTASDDSDIEKAEGKPRKVNRETGFHKPMGLSPIAAEFFGTPKLSRPQVTKQIWAYIKERDLQDPSDKRYILCDDKLRGLLKEDKVHMFKMTKIMNGHLYNPED